MIKSSGDMVSLGRQRGDAALKKEGINLKRVPLSQLRELVAKSGMVGFEFPENVAVGHTIDALGKALAEGAPRVNPKDIVLYSPDCGIMCAAKIGSKKILWESAGQTGQLPTEIVTDWDGKILDTRNGFLD